VVTASQPMNRAADSDELLERVNRPAPPEQGAASAVPPRQLADQSNVRVDAPAPFTVRRGGVEVTRAGGSTAEPRKDQP
jgi:hypothetical protein